MAKVIFLDFYGTLVKWLPAAESIQVAACAKEGIATDAVSISRGYIAANGFMDAANAERPISNRTKIEKERFFTEYEHTLLRAAGITTSSPVARRIWNHVQATPKELAVYDDTIPALEELKAAGFTLGVISNIGPVLGEMISTLGLIQYIDVWISSGEVGATKPHAAIFRAALAKAGVTNHQAIHVGDSYESDVIGAQGVGIEAVLLVREQTTPSPTSCMIIHTLTELPSYLAAQSPKN